MSKRVTSPSPWPLCQKFSFFTESRAHGGVKTQERESGAGGGGGEREVKRKFYVIHRIGRADKEN